MTQRLKRHSIIYLFKIISKFEKKIARFLPSMGWTHPPPYLSPGGTYLKIAPKIPNNFPWGPSMTDFRSLLCSVWAIRERGGGWVWKSRWTSSIWKKLWWWCSLQFLLLFRRPLLLFWQFASILTASASFLPSSTYFLSASTSFPSVSTSFPSASAYFLSSFTSLFFPQCQHLFLINQTRNGQNQYWSFQILPMLFLAQY